MAEDRKPKPDRPVYRAVMIGLAVGSGAFLVGRWLFKLDVETSLIAAGFFGFAVATYLIQMIDRNKT